jgi:2-polyprenyl-3-methyl-5-hydroxy-6-metoxy-1,4-benzoquinol methylase
MGEVVLERRALKTEGSEARVWWGGAPEHGNAAFRLLCGHHGTHIDVAQRDARCMTARTSPARSAVDRWRAMVLAHQAQSQRLRDAALRMPRDFAPPSVDSFRADRERDDDARVLAVLLGLVSRESTVVDVGAGAGRFAIPLAREVARVVAIEPSEAMRAALESDAQRAGVSNLEVVATRWEDTHGISGDLVIASHVVYPLVDIEPFLRRLDSAAVRCAAVLVFERTPLSWLSGFWPRVHGEERLPAPHLPQVIEMVTELGFGPPMVELIDVEPFELGPPDVARQKLRRRLYVAPDSPADQRLTGAMRELLDDRAGVLVPRTETPIRVGLVRWNPSSNTSRE